MKKNSLKVFVWDNKIAFTLVGISLTFATITFIVLYTKFRKMKTATVPVKGRVTSKFGSRKHPVTGVITNHNGVDIAAPLGTPIVAPLDGTVIDVNTHQTGGKQLIIKHINGYRTGYAHLSKYAVNKGDKVKQGQVIAYVGNTGVSTGPHLHFTVTNPMGIKVNPEDYFTFN